MPNEARQQEFWRPSKIDLQHVLQTFFYFMKNKSSKNYFKNTPAPPPPLKFIDGPLMCISTYVGDFNVAT